MVATDMHDDDDGGDDDDDGGAFGRVLYHDLLIRLAVLVGATEAAGFQMRESSPSSLKLLHHIRPDESSLEVRAAAVKAFEDIVLPCVEQAKEGAIEVEECRVPDKGAQYCLVTLTRDAEDVPRAVSAFIVRCRDQREARQRLRLLKGSGSPYREVRSRTEDLAAAAAAAESDGAASAAVAASPAGWRALPGRLCPAFASAGRVGAVLFYLIVAATAAALLHLVWSLLKHQ